MTTSKDTKLLHLILASQNVTQHDPLVSLQLMDFAHRYTSSIMQDAVLYNDYASNSSSSSPITNEDIRLAIAARTAHQFQPVAPKKTLMELAQQRNEKPLPAVMPLWGVRLPPEKYCLTNKHWDLEGSNSE